jgi:hypothetical protein
MYKLIEFNMPKEYTYTVDDILNTFDYVAKSHKTAISVKLNLPGLSIIFCQYLQCGLENFFEPPTRITNARIAETSSVNEVYGQVYFHHLRAAGEMYYKKRRIISDVTDRNMTSNHRKRLHLEKKRAS